jgi:hypothetical protein
MLALGHPELARERLRRMAQEAPAAQDAARFLVHAAQVAWHHQRDPSGALRCLREALGRFPRCPGALNLAESIAQESQAREALFALYDDLLASSPGVHGRHALNYRRAVWLERTGDLVGALREQLALFKRQPSLGATFTTLERLTDRLRCPGELVTCLLRLSQRAPAGEPRAAYLRRAAEVTRERVHDLETSLNLELQAARAAPSPAAEARLVGLARGAQGQAPGAAQGALRALVDDALAAAQQAWEDAGRQGHALRALELVLGPHLDDTLARQAVALYLREHENPTLARRTLRDLLTRCDPPDALWTAVEDALETATSTHMGTARPRLELVPSEPVPGPGPALEPEELSAPEPAASPPSPLPLPVGFTLRAPVAPVASVTLGLPSASVAPGAPTGSAAPAATALPMVEPEPELEAPASATVSTPPLPSEPSEPGATSGVMPAARDWAQASDQALQEASAQGDDNAAGVLARRLASRPEGLDEAIALERRRFLEDPARVDALDHLATLYERSHRDREAGALASTCAVLSGRPVVALAPPAWTLATPPDGVARLLFPPRFSAFAELGTILWEGCGHLYRRDAQRVLERTSDRPRALAVSDLARMFSAAQRLLQLPRTIHAVVRDEVQYGLGVVLSQPPSLVLPTAFGADTPRVRYLLGRALEGTRPSHLLVANLDAEEGARLVDAVEVAFGGRAEGGRMDPSVARLARSLVEHINARTHRRVEALVAELGTRLTYAAWRDAVEVARMLAGMLVAGDFEPAAQEVLAAYPWAGPSPAEAIRVHQHLRELARFAVSDEFLLLRWRT